MFKFDEESLAKSVETAVIDDHESETLDAPHLILQLSSSLKVPEKIRRRSSVYRRFSVRTRVSSISSHNLELIIPSSTQLDDDSPQDHKRVLQDFIPIKVLGKGAYGKVHLVQDKYTKKLYAQKQLRKPAIEIHEETSKHSSHVKRTMYERQILSSINHHSNIVRLFYALQDHDKFYLILEYIPGGELFHHLSINSSGNVFKEDDVAFYAAQMALALRHLHKLGIVYRDLKPENCLLDSRGFLVLTDFGLSKEIGNQDDHCSSIIGTPEYMAPEVLRGDDYDYGVDWWSLGCVIYDMMSGKPPFTGNSHKSIQEKILNKKPQLPFYFSLDAKDMLNKLLNKNPTKRFQVDTNWTGFMNHRFFRKINWKKLENQDDSIIPPIVPVITDPILAENFSPEFTDLNISDYNIDQAINIPVNQNDDFKGFSYTATSSFIDKYH